MKNILKILYSAPRKTKNKADPIITASNVGYLQADLMETKSLNPRKNLGVRYLLIIIDIYSRYAWVYALKDKKPDSVLKCIEAVNDEMKPYGGISTFTSDYGNEFRSVVSKFFKENDIKQYLIHPEKHSHSTAVAERFVRTIVDKIKQLGKQVWVNDLDEIIDEYNNSEHSTLNAKPIDVLRGIHEPMERESKYKRYIDNGDYVVLEIPFEILTKKSRNMRYYPIPFQVIDHKQFRFTLKNLLTGSEHDYQPLQRELKVISRKIANDMKKHFDEIKKIYDNEIKMKKTNKVLLQSSDLINKHEVERVEVNEDTGEIEIIHKKRLRPKGESRREANP